jgi:hypothetical protein
MTNHMLDVERGAVWATMGTGKCVATLTALDLLFLGGETHPALVVGPMRVARDTWRNDALKWKHLRHVNVMPIVGDQEQRRRAMAYDASVYTVSFENLKWLVNHWGDRWPYRTVVADESTRLKGFRLKQGTATPRALARVAHTKIKRLIELTGTPSPNGLANLWGQMWFVDGGVRLGRTYESFRKRWFQMEYDGHSLSPLPYASQEIYDKLRDVCISIDLADYVDITKPIVNDIRVDLPPKARLHYDQMEKDMFTQILDRDVEAFAAAARTQKCLQLASGSVWVNPDVNMPDEKRQWRETHDVKLDALESCFENANGTPQIVSYEFVPEAERILKRFPGGVRLSTPEGFKAFLTGKVPYGLAHPKSMGHGVDGLQEVTNIITHFSHNWDLEKYDQINGRVGPVRQFQIGNLQPCIINRIVANDTVDEAVIARRDGKGTVQDELMDYMKQRAA